MLWFLRDYPLAAIFLRALTLAFDSVLIGGLVFCGGLVPRVFYDQPASRGFAARALRLLRSAACGMVIVQAAFIALDSAMLISTTGIPLFSLYTTNYFYCGALLIDAAVAVLFVGRSLFTNRPLCVSLIAPLLWAIVSTSHSASRLDYRLPLMMLTGLHQLGAAIWLGGMPYLWLLLASRERSSNGPAAEEVVRTARRYSSTALLCFAVLLVAGVILGWFYTQSWSAVYGTGYGAVLVVKSILLVGLLLLGASNFVHIRRGNLYRPRSLARISRLTEAEIGIGFTIVLAAASLSAQPPAVDLVQSRLTMPEIAARMTPRWPSFQTPPANALPPVMPMRQALRQYAASPDDAQSANNLIEQQWSEYNHHWAGIVILAAGLLAMLAKWDRAPWARNWPLAFLGLACFLFLRADPEAWPLGPRGFWISFYNPEDLEHRLFVLLIVAFAAFEWSVQTRRMASARATMVFPAVCAAGGALLLAHNHSLGNVREELLTQMSHSAIALCAVLAGWSRWLELRLTDDRSRMKFMAARAWPLALVLIGLILLNYREA